MEYALTPAGIGCAGLIITTLSGTPAMYLLFNFLYIVSYAFHLPLSFLGGWTLYIVGILAVLLYFPRILGALLTNILYYTALNGHPLIFRHIHLQPWVSGFDALFLHVKAEGVKFGNSVEFKDNPWFIECNWLDFVVSIKISDLLGLTQFSNCKWSPFPSDHSPATRSGKSRFKLMLSVRNLPVTRMFNGRFFLRVEHCRKILHKTEATSNDNEFTFQPFYIKHSQISKNLEAPLKVGLYRKKAGFLNEMIGYVNLEIDQLRVVAEQHLDDAAWFKFLDKDDKTESYIYGDVRVKDDKKMEAGITQLGVSFETNPAARDQGLTYCSLVDFQHLDLEGVTIQFAMSQGVFNINGFTRDIAKAECVRAVERALGPGKWPNNLKIRVLRCRNLGKIGKKPPNVRIHICARDKKASSRLHAGNPSPIIDESFELAPVTDPSTVLHIKVEDEALVSGGKIIGQWVFTLKWFYLNPKYNHHDSIEVLDDHTIRGWFPLLDNNMDVGNNGAIELWFRWDYDEAYDHVRLGTEPKKEKTLTALQQLTENSDETQLRLGNLNNVKEMLRTFPILLNVRRIVLRDVHFYLKDLFKGEAKDLESRDSVHIKKLELHKFKKSYGAQGMVLKDFLKQFVFKILPALKGNTIGSAIWQVIGGVASGFPNLFATKDLEKLMHGDAWLEVGAKLSLWFHRPREQTMVYSYDTDYFKEKILEGLTEISISGGWKLCKAEFKGNTLFFWETDGKTKKSVVRKIDISMVEDMKVLKEGHDHMEIFHFGVKRPYRLRVPNYVARPLLGQWEATMRVYMQRPLFRCIVVRVISALDLPSMDVNGSCDPYFIVSLKSRASKFHGGNDLAQQQRSRVQKKTRNPIYNEYFYLHPVPTAADYVQIDFFDQDQLNADDYIGSMKLSIENIQVVHDVDDSAERNMELCDPDLENVHRGRVRFQICEHRNATLMHGKVKLEDAKQLVISPKDDHKEDLIQKDLFGSLHERIQAKYRSRTPQGSAKEKEKRLVSSTPTSPLGSCEKKNVSQKSQSTRLPLNDKRGHLKSASIAISPSVRGNTHGMMNKGGKSQRRFSAREFKPLRKLEDMEALILADRILRMLDKDDNRRLSKEELLTPLKGFHDHAIYQLLDSFFQKKGLEKIEEKTLRTVGTRKLKKLLGEKIELVYDFLQKRQQDTNKEIEKKKLEATKSESGQAKAETQEASEAQVSELDAVADDKKHTKGQVSGGGKEDKEAKESAGDGLVEKLTEEPPPEVKKTLTLMDEAIPSEPPEGVEMTVETSHMSRIIDGDDGDKSV